MVETLKNNFPVFSGVNNSRGWYLGFWILIFLIWIWNIAILFKAEYLSQLTLLYTIFVFSLILLNHYFLFNWGEKLLHRKYHITYIFMLILLFGLSYIAPLSLEFFAGQFPEYTHMAVLSQRYGIRSFSDVFSLLPFIWVLTSVLFGNIMTATFEAFIRNYETNKRNILLQKEKTEIELNFLKAQFHPHFLFNTLNNIYGLVMENEQAGEAVLKMSDLLRFSLYESKEERISLSREIQFLEDYIHLEKIRHHEHVNIDFKVQAEDHEVRIVPLLLITFVENAFKHGVNNSIRNSCVKICLMQKGNTIAFEVSNSKPAQISKKEAPGGIGLENVKRRLTLLYPHKHELVVSDQKGVFSLALKLTTE